MNKFDLFSKHTMKFLSLVLSATLFLACNNEDNSKNTIDGTATHSNNSETTTETKFNLSYTLKKVFPHDTSSYTQGLLVHNGELYEGTGLTGHSKLLKVDINTGKAIKSHKLASELFGEGIAVLNDTIYQLTWQNQKVLVYTLADFKQIKEFKLNTEGWGITTDGQNLIVSDGTSNLYYYHPKDFSLIKQVTITEMGGPAPYLNELEYINGYVYANQYTTPYIFKIDVNSGKVVGKLDVSELWKRVRNIAPNVDVPNGIAYDADQDKVYITGKQWPELYEIEFAK
jgi:glutamine cyclotransferase